MDEAALENRADYVDERMMDYPVAEMGGANGARLWVADGKDGERSWQIRLGHQFPLEPEQLVLEILLEFDDIRLLRFSPLGILECPKKIVIAAKSHEEMAISLHARIMTPNPESHLVTVGRPPVGVDVLPVVVVVALEKAHYRSQFAYPLPLRLHRFSF